MTPIAVARRRVLFVCTHNACRSQMAEALLRYRYGAWFDACSAGTRPATVHPLAVEVMQEVGIDLSGASSTHVEAYADEKIDYLVTVCSEANQSSPHVRAREMVVHRRFDDPAKVQGSRETRLKAFRSVRDQIDQWIQRFFAAIAGQADERARNEPRIPHVPE